MSEYIALFLTQYFLVILFLAFYNKISVGIIEKYIIRDDHKQILKKVVVIIPMKDEENNAENTLASLLASTHKNFQIIAVDDNSEDRTWDIISKLSKENNGRIVPIRLLEKEQGWVGKNYAISKGYASSDGDILIFMDADVTVSTSTIEKTLFFLEEHYDAISIIPKQRGSFPALSVVEPYLYWWPLTSLPINFLQKRKLPFSEVSCGQFIAIRNEVYDQIRSHENNKDSVVDDIDLFADLKREGFQYKTLFSQGEVSALMYTSWRGSIKGFSKSFFPINNKNFLLILFWIFIFMLNIIPFFLIFIDVRYAGALIMIILIRYTVSTVTQSSLISSLCSHPIQMLNMIIIALYSTYIHIFRKIEWKGRRY